MKLVKKSGITFGTKVASACLNLISGIILARVLGPSGKGIYTMVILIPTMIVMFGNMGIADANIYFVGKNKYSLRDVTSNSLISAILFGLGFVLIASISHGAITRNFLKNCDFAYLNKVIFIIPFLFISRFWKAIILAQNRIMEYNVLQIIQPAVVTLGFVIFLLFFNSGILIAILIWATGVIGVCFCSFLFITRETRIRLRFNYSIFRNIIKFGIKGHIANLSTFLNYRIDMVMISFFKGVNSLGYYSVAVTLGELVWYISDSVARILAPQIARSDPSEANKITPIISRNVLAWSTIVMAGMALLSRDIIKLIYGNQFLPGSLPLRFLSLGIISLSLDKVLSADLLGRGRIEVAMRASVVAMITNLILNLLLIPKYGISGAAIASSVSYTISAILVLFPYLKISNLRLNKILLIQNTDFKFYTLKR